MSLCHLDIESSDINSSLVICVFAFMTIKDASEKRNFFYLNMKIFKDTKVNVIYSVNLSSLLNP